MRGGDDVRGDVRQERGAQADALGSRRERSSRPPVGGVGIPTRQRGAEALFVGHVAGPGARAPARGGGQDKLRRRGRPRGGANGGSVRAGAAAGARGEFGHQRQAELRAAAGAGDGRRGGERARSAEGGVRRSVRGVQGGDARRRGDDIGIVLESGGNEQSGNDRNDHADDVWRLRKRRRRMLRSSSRRERGKAPRRQGCGSRRDARGGSPAARGALARLDGSSDPPGIRSRDVYVSAAFDQRVLVLRDDWTPLRRPERRRCGDCCAVRRGRLAARGVSQGGDVTARG
mmetsp:Transcript_3488/g.13943  ORF Transcript_3488/g.13943 Transcript_3488/m.13943 type:complete len:288 (-) Transcript_3488:177-1040(-)